jgi:Tfp pilus assembly protein PilF/uncharacterized protein YecT (DUF1311 family)
MPSFVKENLGFSNYIPHIIFLPIFAGLGIFIGETYRRFVMPDISLVHGFHRKIFWLTVPQCMGLLTGNIVFAGLMQIIGMQILPSENIVQPTATIEKIADQTKPVSAQVEKEPVPVVKLVENTNPTSANEASIPPENVEKPTEIQQTLDNSQIQKEREELAKYKAKDSFNEANEKINTLLNMATKNVRDIILPEQDEWLKKRENDCASKSSIEEPNNSILQETIKLHCMAVMTDERAEELKQKLAVLEISNNNQISEQTKPEEVWQTIDRYQVKGGLVKDTKTGLMWMRCTFGQDWDGSTCQGKPIEYNWGKMIEVVDSLNYENYDDWRVPTIDELKTLVYCRSGQPKIWNDTGERCEGKMFPPIIDEVFFETKVGWHIVWSSSNDPKYSNLKFVLDFANGGFDEKHKDVTFSARIVRGTSSIISTSKTSDSISSNKQPTAVTEKEAIPTTAEGHVQKMLKAGMIGDDNSIMVSKQYLENLPKPTKGDRKAARKINEEALKLIQSQQYDQAVPLFAKASQTDPSDVEILNNYGFVLMMSNNLSQAETVLIKTLIMKPDRTSAWSNLGYAFALQGKEDMATACYMNAYRFSKNPEKTLQFFKDQLAHENNPNLRSAMIKAVEKAPAPSENTLQATASQKVPDNSQSQEETNIKAKNKLDAANSVYTSLEEKSCKILESHDDEGFISSCPGHAGYQIQIEGGDARSWLIILKNKRPVYDSQTDFLKHPTGNFAAINRKVLEWRYDNAKKLIGLIVRVVAQDKSESPKEISDLFVFRHDNGRFCYAGTHKTNEGAREIADSQTGCKP